ncbi:MAG: alpha/beta hydrolase, partial [Chloroflexi bacterium]|nr:alpha/beta hydrolase [Chloroflexota bacterium]
MLPVPDDCILLPDGRRLSYAEYGDPAGAPVFLFRGTPSSRLACHPDDTIATDLGARVIVTERPGFGRSDFQPGRTLLDWPADVVALADALGLDRFAIVGTSGGGPHAAACAYRIPQRLTLAAIVSGVG